MMDSPAKQIRTVQLDSALVLSFLFASLHLSAQIQSSPLPPRQTPAESSTAAQPPLRFEVASIRRLEASIDEPSNRQILPGGRFVATATTVRTLIRIAFGTDDNLMSGAPGWIDSETFDITATTADHREVNDLQQFQQVILSLLEDRFGFRYHREQKEAAVYWLEIEKPGKLGPGLKPSTLESKPNMSTSGSGPRGDMKVTKMSMPDIAAALRRQVGRPVEDHTDLKGNFDFQIEWSTQESSDSPSPSLFTVLKEDLGLKLQSGRGTTNAVIIDQITQPTAN